MIAQETTEKKRRRRTTPLATGPADTIKPINPPEYTLRSATSIVTHDIVIARNCKV
jgi:hypothetical protein